MNQAIQPPQEIFAFMDHRGEYVGLHFNKEKAIKAVIKLRDLGFIYDLYSQQYFSVNRHGETKRFDMAELKPPATPAPDRFGMEE